jgi:FkbM family methyltransferase
MRLFSRLVQPGDVVLDVGGHIGYTALHFASLVGRHGRVLVFEPSPENLRFLRKNVRRRPEIEIIAAGAGPREMSGTLYVERLSGQNNSFISEFHVFTENRKNAFCLHFESSAVESPLVTVDKVVADRHLSPRLVKIDVEGFEREVLAGMSNVLLRCRPILMVEVQRNHADVLSTLTQSGYRLFTSTLNPVDAPGDFDVNTFCLHREAHAVELAGLLGLSIR